MNRFRTWVLRLGGTMAFAALAGAAWGAHRMPGTYCPRSTPLHGYACDAQSPTHPHLLAAAALAGAAVAVVLATIVVAAVWKESIWWTLPRGQRRI